MNKVLQGELEANRWIASEGQKRLVDDCKIVLSSIGFAKHARDRQAAHEANPGKNDSKNS
jgi:hypothetical protein